jgi:VIT1/CCC1 family predicted Fe2+/Mn2+ transporter
MGGTIPDYSPKRILEPVDRISEVLFGLIMVLTFTGSLSVAEAGRDDVRAMLIGALGCNVAWGVIDGIMYLMGCLGDRARTIRIVQSVRTAASPVEAHRVIASAVPPELAATLQPPELERMRLKVNELSEPPARPRLSGEDWRGAVGVFLLVFLATFPVVVPFLFVSDAMRAMRLSNAIAIAMLFATGYAFGHRIGARPWLAGLVMVVLGTVLVGITIALGG